MIRQRDFILGLQTCGVVARAREARRAFEAAEMETFEEHEGYLWFETLEGPGPDKQREWKHYWFVLDEGYLKYYHKDDDVEPVAAVPCRGIVAKSVGKSRVGKHAFRLDANKQEDGRCKYVLAGDDEADSLVWLEFLRDHGCSVNLSKIRVSRSACVGAARTVCVQLTRGGVRAFAADGSPRGRGRRPRFALHVLRAGCHDLDDVVWSGR